MRVFAKVHVCLLEELIAKLMWLCILYFTVCPDYQYSEYCVVLKRAVLLVSTFSIVIVCCWWYVVMVQSAVLLQCGVLKRAVLLLSTFVTVSVCSWLLMVQSAVLLQCGVIVAELVEAILISKK